MGDLTVRNAKLLVADVHAPSRYREQGSLIPKSRREISDLLIGSDFLRANRVLIANSQGLMYFTYNGGQIFQTAGETADEYSEDDPDAGSTDTQKQAGPQSH